MSILLVEKFILSNGTEVSMKDAEDEKLNYNFNFYKRQVYQSAVAAATPRGETSELVFTEGNSIPELIPSDNFDLTRYYQILEHYKES